MKVSRFEYPCYESTNESELLFIRAFVAIHLIRSIRDCENIHNNFTLVSPWQLILSHYKFYSRVYEQHSITREL
jgi:hypothetical protein